MAPDEVVLHDAGAARAITTLWMLEELGVPYRLARRDAREPAGRGPTLQVGRVVVSETAAICTYLADRYGYGSLAPCIEHPDRGPWLRWMAFAAAALEPVAST